MDPGRFLIRCAILVLAFSCVSGQGTATCINCCQNYENIGESRRSVQSQWKSGQAPLCDKDLKKGWYRFTSFVGGKMPTKKVNINHCGTKAPIWLDGTTNNHPSRPTDPVVRIKACVNVFGRRRGCFDWFYVSVKYCPGNFFVYFLQPTYSCYRAYCAGKKQEIMHLLCILLFSSLDFRIDAIFKIIIISIHTKRLFASTFNLGFSRKGSLCHVRVFPCSCLRALQLSGESEVTINRCYR